MKRTLVTGACLLLLTGCAAFPFHGSREVAGVRTADALSEIWPADAERFASQAALELSRRYPAGQTGLSLVTVPGQFGTSLENQLRGHGFAIFPQTLLPASGSATSSTRLSARSPLPGISRSEPRTAQPSA